MGNNIGVLIIIIMLLVGTFLGFRLYDEMRYSWKQNQEMNNNNATCYFDRGWFNIPLAKICSYNQTVLVEKEYKGWYPRLEDKE